MFGSKYFLLRNSASRSSCCSSVMLKCSTADDLIIDPATGTSHISVQDYAVAMVDELEEPAHHKERFTIGY